MHRLLNFTQRQELSSELSSQEEVLLFQVEMQQLKADLDKSEKSILLEVNHISAAAAAVIAPLRHRSIGSTTLPQPTPKPPRRPPPPANSHRTSTPPPPPLRPPHHHLLIVTILSSSPLQPPQQTPLSPHHHFIPLHLRTTTSSPHHRLITAAVPTPQRVRWFSRSTNRVRLVLLSIKGACSLVTAPTGCLDPGLEYGHV
ncbi:hypothetical protein Tco_1414657 [Tanacetum coccineum]